MLNTSPWHSMLYVCKYMDEHFERQTVSKGNHSVSNCFGRNNRFTEKYYSKMVLLLYYIVFKTPKFTIKIGGSETKRNNQTCTICTVLFVRYAWTLSACLLFRNGIIYRGVRFWWCENGNGIRTDEKLWLDTAQRGNCIEGNKYKYQNYIQFNSKRMS